MADRFLDTLAESLTPVRPIKPVAAICGAVALTLAGGAVVLATLGLRDQYAGATLTDPMFLIRAGLLLLLGAASLIAVTAMARPAVGAHRNGWRWALGAAAIVPVAALITALVGESPVAARLYPQDGVECLRYSIGIGLVLGAALTLWLRRGAPVSPERAGIVIGLASGSLGALAYSLHCPHNDIVYIGLWYTLAITITTLLGRLIVPRFIRW